MANTQLRHFAFTWNNYNKHEGYFEELCYILEFPLEANYFIFAHEVAPTTGTPHLQGYVQLKKRKYFNAIKKLLPEIHITLVHGSSQENIDYCKKDDNYYEYGTLRTIGRGRHKQKEDWDLLISLASTGQLDEIREHHPRDYLLYYRTLNQLKMDNMAPVAERRTCLWIYGEPGIGKSRAVWNLFPDAYPKMANKWWDGYKGENEVVLDDLGTPMLFDLLKRWTDRYKVIGEVKGLSCALAYHTFVVTSNYSIRDLARKGNQEVDEVTIQAIQRRFVEAKALEWDLVEQDTLVLESRHNIKCYLKDLYYQDDSYVDRVMELNRIKCQEIETKRNITNCDNFSELIWNDDII